MSYDFVSGKEAVKELRNLHKKLKEWDRFDDPTLGERGTVQEVAEKYGWGLVAEKLLKDIRERKADDDSIEITCRMLLKAKSTKKKEKQLRKAMKKSPSDPNYGSVIKVEEEIVVPTEEVTKTLSECLFEIEKYAQEQGVEARLRKQINYEILVKKMMKNIKEGTLRNLLSKIKI